MHVWFSKRKEIFLNSYVLKVRYSHLKQTHMRKQTNRHRTTNSTMVMPYLTISHVYVSKRIITDKVYWAHYSKLYTNMPTFGTVMSLIMDYTVCQYTSFFRIYHLNSKTALFKSLNNDRNCVYSTFLMVPDIM